MNIQGVGTYDIPAIAPAEYQEAELISFNYAKSCKSPADKAVHFLLMIINSTEFGTALMIISRCLESSSMYVRPTLVCTQTTLEPFRFITTIENIGVVPTGRLTASEWYQRLDGVTRLALHGALTESQQTV